MHICTSCAVSASCCRTPSAYLVMPLRRGAGAASDERRRRAAAVRGAARIHPSIQHFV